MCVPRACLSKFVSATGLYSETIALVCHISGHCSPCKGHNQAYQGMEKSPLQRCDNSKELNNTWLLYQGRATHHWLLYSSWWRKDGWSWLEPVVKKGKLCDSSGAAKLIPLDQECLKLALGSNGKLHSFIHLFIQQLYNICIRRKQNIIWSWQILSY